VSVVDGDIIKIERDWKNVTVRMIGIDAPEGTTTRYWYVEDFWKEATAYLTNLLSWIKEVEIELDDSQWEYDIYQRLLAYIFVNWINVNQKMLEDWYAIEYTYNKPYKYQQSFKTAYVNAENYGKGMFSSVKITQTNNSSPSSTSSSSSETYSCGLKNYCTEMKSCTEAKYYLNTCWLTKLDSDKDGIPCESLCS
jgi:endonuclease YncB( thermonuclease family)